MSAQGGANVSYSEHSRNPGYRERIENRNPEGVTLT